MNMFSTGFSLYVPFLWVFFMVCALLMLDVFSKNRTNKAYYCAQFTVVFAAYFTWRYMPLGVHVGLYHHVIVDHLARVADYAIYIAVFFSLLYGERFVRERKLPQGEYYALALLSMLGMMVLASGDSLLTLYLGLELMSLPLYAMIALWRTSSASTESAMKYFILGAIASGCLLYGMSLLYGATQHLNLQAISLAIVHQGVHHHPLLVLAMVFIVVGVVFKLGAAPFHLWVPDVFAGAPTSVTVFISAAPKLAAAVLLFRLLGFAMPALLHEWRLVLTVIAILSMGIGNLVAIAQTRIKRMFAYSSIAHAGYFLLGVIAGTKAGYAAAWFYMLTYALTALAAFGVLLILSRDKREIDSFDSLQGLGHRNPWVAFLMMLLLFSMAGIPPLVGFIAKLGVLTALIQVHLTWLAVVAIIFAIIGAYYYIRVVKVLYFESPKEAAPLQHTRQEVWALSVNGLAVLFLGIFPGSLLLISHFM